MSDPLYGLTIQSLVEQSHSTALNKGWYGDDGKQERNFGEVIALMHSELTEALEDYRNGHGLDELYYLQGMEGTETERTLNAKPCGIPIEFADVIIRIADTCGRHGIDLETALKIKMEYNESRPYRHGGKVA